MSEINKYGIKRALAAHAIHECARARCPLFCSDCINSCQDKLAGLALKYIEQLENQVYILSREPEQIALEFEADAHSCRANADDFGYCTVCGAIVSGTCADYSDHGYDPPESVRY